jgi:hypothetical protein
LLETKVVPDDLCHQIKHTQLPDRKRNASVKHAKLKESNSSGEAWKWQASESGSLYILNSSNALRSVMIYQSRLQDQTYMTEIEF